MWHAITNRKIGLTVKTNNLDEVRRYFHAWMKIGVDLFDIYIQPDPDMVTPLEYQEMVNIPAEYLHQNPDAYPNCWMGHLAMADRYEGDRTARRMDDDLFWSTFSDSYKDACGFRPRGFTGTRAEAERVLESLYREYA